jgi:nucleoside diphosphate kinase
LSVSSGRWYYSCPEDTHVRSNYQYDYISMYNLLHASADLEDAAREIALWFQPEELLPEE